MLILGRLHSDVSDLWSPSIPGNKCKPEAIINCQGESHSLALNHTLVPAHS